jgi:translation initiation factor IF-1
MPDAAIHTTGEVLAVRGGPLYEVSLPNGKRVHAHLCKTLAEAGAVFREGDILRLELTPYDFDQARILCREG